MAGDIEGEPSQKNKFLLLIVKFSEQNWMQWLYALIMVL